MDEKYNTGLFPFLIGVVEILQLVPGRREWAEMVFLCIDHILKEGTPR